MNFIRILSNIVLSIFCLGQVMGNQIDKNSKIYVAGHTGLVGSALVRQLNAAGYTNIIVQSSKQLDLRNQQAVQDFFRTEKPEYVLLAAAKVGGILANNTYPAEFIYDNLMISVNVIHAAYTHGVKKLINLGSSCIYPKLAPQPLHESSLLSGPLEPTNEAYAVAKIAAIKLCHYYYKQYGANFISVMPTNLYGPQDNFNLETSHVLPALLRKVHLASLLQQNNFDAIVQDLKTYRLGYDLDEKIDMTHPSSISDALRTAGITSNMITLWGTGSPMREFLHVDDLANGLIYILENLNAQVIGEFVNIGVGSDLSLLELTSLIKNIVGFQGTLSFDATKPDGTPKKLLDVSTLQKLGWKAQIGLHDGIKQVYEWYTRK